MSKNKFLFMYIPTLLPSMNKWNTTHFRKKHKQKEIEKDIIINEIRKHAHVKFKKVRISFQCVLGTNTDFELMRNGKKRKKRNNTKRDIINNAPTIKFIEDCIVREGILEDDNNNFVLGHTIYPDIIDREIEGCGIMVLIEEIDYKPSMIDIFNKHCREDYLLKNNSENDKKNKDSKDNRNDFLDFFDFFEE